MQGPYSLETVVEGLLGSVGDGVPDIDNIIFSCREDDWDVGVEQDRCYIVRVTIFEGEETLLCLVVPHFDLTIITTTD